MKIILIVGNRRAGKDTLCQMLANLDYWIVRQAFADELKRDLNHLFRQQFDISPFDLDGELKEKLRPILIAYGCSWRAIDPLHWVKKVDEQLDPECDITYCIVDGRFRNEIEHFREKYGRAVFVVGLNRPDVEPTDEEKKNWPEIVPLVDYWAEWPRVENVEELRPYAKKVYEEFCKWVS